MPVSSSPSTSKRLLALLSLLQSRRDWPAHALAARLQVSERTVRRDVDRLRELDYAIDATRGPAGGYRLEAGTRLPPMLFDDEQALAVVMTLRTAGTLGAGLEDAAERALSTLGRLMPADLARRMEGLAAMTAAPARAPHADPAVLLRIGEAIRLRQELRFDYDGPARVTDGPPAPMRRVEPHHLLLHAGRWYLIGRSPEHDDWRTHRVDRIRPSEHTGRAFTPRTIPGGDAAAWLSARFKGSTGADVWPCRGEAVVHLPLAGIAPYVGDGTVAELTPGRCRVRLGAWSWSGLAASFARFDADVTDAQPEELRIAFGALAARARAAAG